MPKLYCSLLCHVWMISLEGVLVSEGNGRGVDLGMRKVGGGREEWREKKLSSRCVVYEKNK